VIIEGAPVQSKQFAWAKRLIPIQFPVKLMPTPARQPGLASRHLHGIGEQLTNFRFWDILFTFERGRLARTVYFGACPASPEVFVEGQMRITTDQSIAGYPALQVRQFIRKYRFTNSSNGAAEAALMLSTDAGANFLSKLADLGFIGKSHE
jgi:hypothetical protein